MIDHPAPGLLSQFANPAVSVILTGENNKPTELKISMPSGDFVYAQVSDSSLFYKLKKQVAEDLNIKACGPCFSELLAFFRRESYHRRATLGLRKLAGACRHGFSFGQVASNKMFPVTGETCM